MAKAARGTHRRQEALSRERIVAASIELLDRRGEDGLTFRALAERLATGAGAIYWHIAHKGELLTAACDAIVARALEASAVGATPHGAIRAVALSLFDAMDAHPWVGSALVRAEWHSPLIRVIERLGQPVCALGVPETARWATVSALGSYILGVGGQNAANGQFARGRGIDRADFLDAVAKGWSQLDPGEYPFTRSVAGELRAHDDRADFLTGIDLILRGIDSVFGRAATRGRPAAPRPAKARSHPSGK